MKKINLKDRKFVLDENPNWNDEDNSSYEVLDEMIKFAYEESMPLKERMNYAKICRNLLKERIRVHLGRKITKYGENKANSVARDRFIAELKRIKVYEAIINNLDNYFMLIITNMEDEQLFDFDDPDITKEDIKEINKIFDKEIGKAKKVLFLPNDENSIGIDGNLLYGVVYSNLSPKEAKGMSIAELDDYMGDGDDDDKVYVDYPLSDIEYDDVDYLTSKSFYLKSDKSNKALNKSVGTREDHELKVLVYDISKIDLFQRLSSGKVVNIRSLIGSNLINMVERIDEGDSIEGKKVLTTGFFRLWTLDESDNLLLTEDVEEHKKAYMDIAIKNSTVLKVEYQGFANNRQLLKVLSDYCRIRVKDLKHSETLGNEFLDYPLREKESYKFKRFKPNNVLDVNENIMDQLDEKVTIMIDQPYDSYEPVPLLIEEAAVDPKVTVIKQTLYRTAGVDSRIVSSLKKAAENKKFVQVLCELKARDNQIDNINIQEVLEESGAHMLNTIDMKIHIKMLLIRKKHGDKLKKYAVISTGNFNESTAKFYADYTIMTSDPLITEDVERAFNYIKNVNNDRAKDNGKYMTISPARNKARLTLEFDRCIEAATSGKPASIIIKCNGITEEFMVDKIYEAADAGVKINIIARAVNTVKEGKNIKCKRIFGRFLEHARVYQFTTEDLERTFIGSMDLRDRNVNNRLESLLLIDDTNSKILEKINYDLSLNLVDNTWENGLTNEGSISIQELKLQKLRRDQI